MMNKQAIDQFYRDVDDLDLKFPVAAIAKALGMSKGNVSKYLNRKLEPSEAFMKGFYEKVYESSKEVSRPMKPDKTESLIVQLMQRQNQLMEMQNKILEEQKESLVKKVDKIETTVVRNDQNVTKLKRGLQNVNDVVHTATEVVLRSLARLEGKPENHLLKDANKKTAQKGLQRQKLNKQSVEGN